MNWKTALEKSPHGCAVAFVEKGHALRLVNAAGGMFKIESPQGHPKVSENSKRMLGRLDWEPVLGVRTKQQERFIHFHELMSTAALRAAPTVCDLHEGPRGLVAMTGEWCDRLKTLLAGVEELREVEYNDPELPNKLEAISIEALKMRELL